MGHIRKLVFSLIAGLALLVMAPAATASDEPDVGTQMYIDCGTRAVEFKADGVRIRRQPNLSSSVNGYGYRGQDAWIHRVVGNGPNNHWLDLTNLVTGVRGYVKAGAGFTGCR